MSDREPRGFSRRHREGVERIRRKNLEGRETSNVVPLRRPRRKPGFSWPTLSFNPLVLWALIIAALIAIYLARSVV